MVDTLTRAAPGMGAPAAPGSKTGAFKTGLIVSHLIVMLLIVAASGATLFSSSTGTQRHVFGEYSLVVPASVGVIDGIELQFDARVLDASGSAVLVAELSSDGGRTWTSIGHRTPRLTDQDLSYRLGSATDPWGRRWSASVFDGSDKFRVRISTFADSASGAVEVGTVGVRLNHAFQTDEQFHRAESRRDS
jgi:hypothetical protein